MNMADRLPGKIYDDLGHILKGLPVEKQVRYQRGWYGRRRGYGRREMIQ